MLVSLRKSAGRPFALLSWFKSVLGIESPVQSPTLRLASLQVSDTVFDAQYSRHTPTGYGLPAIDYPSVATS